MKFALAALFIALAATAALAQSHPPQYMRVTGVAADDTLTVRAEASADSADLGSLPSGTSGIEVIGTDATGDWGRILWEDGNGWLAMQFLEADPLETIGDTALPVGLQCGGTEPFWTLRLSQGSASYSDLSDLTLALSLAGVRVAMGYQAFPVALQHVAEDGRTLSVIQPLSCSDDMSDRDYPYGLTVLLEASGGTNRFLAGCCWLPLEAGQH